MAEFRYNKDEMLAVSDEDHVGSPKELRANDNLYKSKPKQPFALNRRYEEVVRENTRIGVRSFSARSPSGHDIVIGRGRETCWSDSRGRPRMLFTSGLGRGPGTSNNWGQSTTREDKLWYPSDQTKSRSIHPNQRAILQSQTFNNISRTKNLKQEWWASEKANKLLPKKFEVGDIKTTKNRFLFPTSESSEDTTDKKLDSAQSSEKKNMPSTSGENGKNKTTSDKIVKRKIIKEQNKQNTNQKPMENNDDHGNFQCVMLTPNNSLRQKHQNTVHPAGNKNENIQNNQQQSVQGLDMGTKTMPQKRDRNVDGKITKVTEKAPEIISTKVSTTVPGKDSSIIAPLVNNLGQGLSDTMSPRVGTAPGFFHSNLTFPIIPTGSQVTQYIAKNTPIMPGNSILGMDMTQQHPDSNSGLLNPLLGSTFQVQGGSLPVHTGRISAYPLDDQANRTSLFMGQNASNTFNPPPAVSMPNQASHMFPIQGLSHSSSQIPFTHRNPMYDVMFDWWYYEDPKKVIQGPFTSHDMYNWYTAGFFKSTLMIRRAVDMQMRSLGSYGPVVPFAPFSLLDQELPNQMDQFRRLGGTPQGQQNVFGQHQNMAESLDHPIITPCQRDAINTRNSALVNNLSKFIWEQKQQRLL